MCCSHFTYIIVECTLLCKRELINLCTTYNERNVCLQYCFVILLTICFVVHSIYLSFLMVKSTFYMLRNVVFVIIMHSAKFHSVLSFINSLTLFFCMVKFVV